MNDIENDYEHTITGTQNIEVSDVNMDDVDFAQTTILSFLITYPKLWSKAAPIIKAEYFDKEFQPTVRFIFNFVSQYKKLPSRNIIRSETGLILDIPDMELDDDIERYLCHKIEEFCRYRAFSDFLYRSSEKIVKDKSRNTMEGLIKEGQSLARLSITRDLGFEVHSSAKIILEKAKANDGISTGLKLVDFVMDGGITRPSFNLYSASSGDGKSIWLANMAYNYALRGENVIFYTLELEPELIQKRFSAIMTNTDIKLVYREIDAIHFSLNQKKKTEGMIWVKKFPMVGTTVADIEAHYVDLCIETKVNWSVVCLDYLDLIKPLEKVSMDNIHLKDKYSSQEFNDFIHNNKLIGWSASQQIKGAKEEKEARQSGVSGGTDKVNVCDNLLIGKRSEQDRLSNILWVMISKARSSGATHKKVPVTWNPNTQRMTDGPEDLFYEANPFYESATKKEDNRFNKDALAKSMNVTYTSSPQSTIVGKEKSGKNVIDKLYNRFSRTT